MFHQTVGAVSKSCGTTFPLWLLLPGDSRPLAPALITLVPAIGFGVAICLYFLIIKLIYHLLENLERIKKHKQGEKDHLPDCPTCWSQSMLIIFVPMCFKAISIILSVKFF